MKLLKPLEWLAGALLLAIMATTVIDVLGRYIVNRPLSGAIEITELTLGVMIFAGVALAAARGEHVRVDLLDSLLGQRWLRASTLFGSLISCLVAAFLAWRLFYRAQDFAKFNDVSSHLGVPLAPLAYGMAALAAIAAVTFVVVFWRTLRGRSPHTS